MTPAQAFELAARQARTTETVTGHAHAAVNAKAAIDEARAMAGEFERLTFALQPFALEYAADMPDDQLRAWAADLVAVLRG